MDISLKLNTIAGYLKRRRAGRYQGEFIFRLGEMLNQGFAIGDALEFLLINFDRNHRESIRLIRTELNAGTPLNEILHMLHFPSMICLQVYFAEKHGRLPETLLHAGEHWKKTEQAKEKLVKLLQYPLFLLFLLFMLLFLLNYFLMPRFEELYAALNFTPSGSTFLLITFLQKGPPFILLAAGVLAAASLFVFFQYQRQTPQSKIHWLIKTPITSTYFPLLFTRLFAKEVSSLLKSGFAVNEVLLILQEQTMHPVLRHVASEINSGLVTGQSFAEAAEQMSCFVPQLPRILRHGETNGRLAQELFLFSHFCETLLEKKIKRSLSILQPSIFLCVGLVVIAIYLSVMLPMFQMVGSI
ncbi:competence type IV pilus assembly protein ComGB [Bacillus sp. FJAT-27231]|uniref:competence type IV pilus assembly protein ComGB n=1 Tax=Bacillus sp. FJAT-27231 TaxID=1679168 RepID=UPI001E32C880|nr:competence type IV pilus assembly protein ComGB [Bacillus sp. FJAT-27231]